MKDLIKISERNGNPVINAKDLHEFLEVKSSLTTWCERMFTYGFIEGKDFIPFSEESTGGRPSTNYAFTLDMAKELSMIQRTDRGKEAREYFIAVEKKYQQQVNPLSQIDIILQSAQVLKQHDNSIKELQQGQTDLTEQINRMEAQQTVTDENYFSLVGYYRLKNRRFDLSTIQAQQTGKLLTSKSKEMFYKVNHVHSAQFGHVGSYHIFILQATLGF